MTEKPIVKVARWISDYILELTEIGLNGLGYAIIGALYEHGDKLFLGRRYDFYGFWLIIILFFLNLIVGYFIIQKNKRQTFLEFENDNLSNKLQRLETDFEELYGDYLQLFSEQLALIFIKLGYTANERISVYRHEGEKFVIIGRYSNNPTFNQINHKQFPNNEGFISQAWESQQGELYIGQIPKYETNKKRQNPYYDFVKSKCIITPQRLTKMRMKSRNYYLKVINDNSNLKRVAIIVFESIDENKLAKDKINDVIEFENQRLNSFITKMRLEKVGQEYANIIGL
ncbi:MAG: hypothetical protein RL311_1159 [Bacteroidota bacterium]|jgi:hypothetical protein